MLNNNSSNSQNGIPTLEPADEQITTNSEVLPFSADEIDTYERIKAELPQKMEALRDTCLEIGKQLYYIERHRLYRLDGFHSTAELAEATWDISKKTCSLYIGICKYFGALDEEANACLGLRDEYSQYSEAQLEELIPVARKYPEHLDRFPVTLTVLKIRAEKKALFAEMGDSPKGSSCASEESPAAEPAVIETIPAEPVPAEPDPTEVSEPPASARPKRKRKRIIQKKLLIMNKVPEPIQANEEFNQRDQQFREEYPNRKIRYYVIGEAEEESA